MSIESELFTLGFKAGEAQLEKDSTRVSFFREHARKLASSHGLKPSERDKYFDPGYREGRGTVKSNPSQSELADIGYEHFHGRPSMKLIEDEIDWPPPNKLEEQFGPFPELPEDVAALGELISLMYEDEDTLDDEVIEFDGQLPLLVTDYAKEGREALYITGGDYEVEIWDDFICGPLRWITYRTVKSFDDFEPTEYKHWFAEPNPILAHNHDGTQLYIFRAESRFSIDRSRPTSLGIDG